MSTTRRAAASAQRARLPGVARQIETQLLRPPRPPAAASPGAPDRETVRLAPRQPRSRLRQPLQGRLPDARVDEVAGDGGVEVEPAEVDAHRLEGSHQLLRTVGDDPRRR